jgi:crotonobetainyl-CoA:carnitine CoA-transferase CaiB-like acyl-CoA transferase
VSPDRPLDGLRILSLAEQYPGPYATLLLADLGADVVLVERPNGGDPARAVSAGFFEGLNRNKRSLAVDLKRAEGREILVRLARDADVLLEGFRPGAMDRLGLGYDALRELNQGLVYVSISGFGQDGPLRDRAAHDLTYQGIAGLLYERVASRDVSPTPAPAVGDLSAGMFGALAALTGLVQRSRTGRGCHVDVSMLDGLVSWMSALLVPAINGLGRVGLPRQPAYGLFETADRRLLSLSIAHEDRFWRALCEATGLGDEAATLDVAEREARVDELRARLAGRIAQRTLAAWTEDLGRADICFGPVNDLADVAADEQVVARQLVVELAGEGERPARRHVRQPLRFDGAGPGPRRHVPGLGEHTREVLAEAGVDADAIDDLIASGVVAADVPSVEMEER